MNSGNQWAYINNFTISRNPTRVDSFSGASYQIAGLSTVEFSGIAPLTPQIMDAMKRWMNNPSPELPTRVEEWLCLYCGGVNRLESLKCYHCNAVRSWLIG